MKLKISILLENNKEKILNDYSSGYSMQKISEELRISISEISKVFKLWGVKARPKNQGLNYKLPISKEKIKSLYFDNGMSTEEIAKICGTSRGNIWEHLKKMKCTLRTSPEAHKIYTLNDKFFEEMNSPIHYYWFGFLMADGYNNEKKRVVALRLSGVDTSHILKFQESISTNAPVKEFISNSRLFGMLDICSKKLSEDLAKLGCVQAKTKILTFPTVPDIYQKDFIRGYFDGDGSICQSKTASCMDIAGTKEFLLDCQKILMRECALNLTKLNPVSSIFTLRYGGNIQLKRIYDYFYYPGCIKLDRKYDKFRKILKLTN